ncbi:MAG: hypothetical protein JSS64_14350 [Bacteroidetes bacterium]|nr:hypothetical protein [Bacteroidota bacterium]
MKKILLSFSLLTMVFTVSAQKFEVGLNAGVSTTSKPHKSLYKGGDNVYNYATNFKVQYNINERWQIGGELGLTKWQRKDQWALDNTNNQSLGKQEVKLLIAQSATSFSLQANHVIPFYERYEDFVRSAIYLGVSAGAVIVGNDGKVNYSRVNPNTPAEYTYASQYNFESGFGMLLGFQIGYSYYFNSRLGINLDIAPKATWVHTNDVRQGGANNYYNLWYIPTTIGIRYRLGFE